MDDAIKTLLDTLLNQWAPAALELGVRMTWYQSISVIVGGFIWVVIAYVMYRVIEYDMSVMVTAIYETKDWNDNPMYLINLVRCVIAFIVLLTAICIVLAGGLLDPWSWVGLYDPMAKLAHDIYLAVMKK